MKAIHSPGIALCLILSIGAHNASAQKILKDSSRIMNDKALHLYMRNSGNRDSTIVAINYLEQAIAYDPGNSIAYSNKANFQSGIGMLPDAIVTLDRSIALNKSSKYYCMFVKANLMEALGNTDSAKLIYRDVIKGYDSLVNNNPKSVALKLSRVYSLLFLNKDEAIVEIKKLKNAYPDNKEVAQMEMDIDRFDRSEYLEHFKNQR